jgi:hypothetical protein
MNVPDQGNKQSATHVYYLRRDFEERGEPIEESIDLLEDLNAPPTLIEVTRDAVRERRGSGATEPAATPDGHL